MLHELVMVDILLATYNGEKYLQAQLDSILKQTYTAWKLIIHDDGSTDNTVSIIEQYRRLYPDKIIVIEDTLKTGSAKNNFSYLMSYVSSSFIALCDQDDIWFPQKLSTIMMLLQTCDLVVHDLCVIDEDGKIMYDSFFVKNHSKQGFYNNLVHNAFIGCAMAFNRKIYHQIVPIPHNVVMHDWWIGLMAKVHGNVIFCEEKLMYYRRHDSNISTSSQMSSYTFWRKIYFRIIMVYWVLFRSLLRKLRT